MTSEFRRRAYALFCSVLNQPDGAIHDFLEEYCGDDGPLRAEVESLLSAERASADFLEVPAIWCLADAAGRHDDKTYSAVEETLGQRIGTKISHYELQHWLGAGGMGEVYGARDSALGRPAAVKILRQQLAKPLNLWLQREGETLARLQHPAISTFFEGGYEHDTAFLAMELVAGQTLRERLGGGSLSAKECVGLAVQLLEGLAHAHAAGVIHGDIKPENIILGVEGQVKLLDFGIAQILADDSENSEQRRRVVGTLGYMSPEQRRGEPLDERSDLYALGVVLAECLGGTLPRLDSLGATANVRRENPANVNGESDTKVPAALLDAIKRALARRPNVRYQTATEFLRDLRAVDAAARTASSPSASPAKDDRCAENIQPGSSHGDQRSKAAWASTQSFNPDAVAIYNRARELAAHRDKGAMQQAAELYTEVIAMDPRFSPALVALASLSAMRYTYTTDRDALSEAAEYCRRALVIDANDGEAYAWLSYIRYNQGQRLEGLRHSQEAIRLSPDNFFSHYFGAGVFAMSCTRDEALRLYRCATGGLGIDDPHAWRREQAIACYQRALAIDPYSGWAWLGLGWCHLEQNCYEEACWCLQRAVELERKRQMPTAGVAGYLGECLRRQGRLVEARENCLSGLQAVEATDHMYRDTWRAVCLCALGRTALDQDNDQRAEAAFVQAAAHLKGRPRARAAGHTMVQALAGLAAARRDSRSLDEAEQLFHTRERYDFNWLWGCSETVDLSDLMRAARALRRSDRYSYWCHQARQYGLTTEIASIRP